MGGGENVKAGICYKACFVKVAKFQYELLKSSLLYFRSILVLVTFPLFLVRISIPCHFGHHARIIWNMVHSDRPAAHTKGVCIQANTISLRVSILKMQKRYIC